MHVKANKNIWQGKWTCNHTELKLTKTTADPYYQIPFTLPSSTKVIGLLDDDFIPENYISILSQNKVRPKFMPFRF